MTDSRAAMTTPDFVVLGMISRGARTGYEIKKGVATSIRFFWTISEAQIYPSLERLERAGLVASRPAPKGRRRRQVFELTRAGGQALHDWLALSEPMPFELRDVGLVRLFFADALSRGEARALLDAVKRRSEARIAALLAIRPAATEASEGPGDHPRLTLRMGVAFHQAMIDVCEAFERETAAT
jgi:DNA-binding PadR family transcriptional regulator